MESLEMVWHLVLNYVSHSTLGNISLLDIDLQGREAHSLPWILCPLDAILECTVRILSSTMAIYIQTHDLDNSLPTVLRLRLQHCLHHEHWPLQESLPILRLEAQARHRHVVRCRTYYRVHHHPSHICLYLKMQNAVSWQVEFSWEYEVIDFYEYLV